MCLRGSKARCHFSLSWGSLWLQTNLGSRSAAVFVLIKIRSSKTDLFKFFGMSLCLQFCPSRLCLLLVTVSFIVLFHTRFLIWVRFKFTYKMTCSINLRPSIPWGMFKFVQWFMIYFARSQSWWQNVKYNNFCYLLGLRTRAENQSNLLPH